MRILFLTLYIGLLLPMISLAQSKHGNIWTLGYGDIAPSQTGYPFGGVIMDFNVSPPSLTLQDYVIDRPRAVISDGNGNLVAYTDGCRILNRKHQIMLKGDTINPGGVFTAYCELGDYPYFQPALFLPAPGSDSLYYLFHMRGNDFDVTPIDLLYSVLDASGDNGDGMVVSKNNKVLEDSLYLGDYVAATRHGNGRDWWVTIPRWWSNGVHVALLRPEGVEYKGIQSFDGPGIEVDSQYCCSQALFSPDGSKYFRNGPQSLWVFDFDRCQGVLSNPIRLDWDSLPFGGGGAAVSPNSRFLYLSSGGTVQQYDLWAPDLAKSMQVVAEYDGTLAPYPANFFLMMPGPDGKIYIICSYDNNVLHVIHNPNDLGLACNVEQHAITLPARQGYIALNVANYNLGPLDPPCTSNVEPEIEHTEWTLHPNPATNLIHWTGIHASRVQVYDLLGRLCTEQSAANDRADLSALPPGAYLLVLLDVSGRRVAAKVALRGED